MTCGRRKRVSHVAQNALLENANVRSPRDQLTPDWKLDSRPGKAGYLSCINLSRWSAA